MRQIKLISFFLIIFFYLLFFYIRFYHFIGDVNLKSPYTVTSLTLDNPKGDGSVKYVALGDSLSAGVGSQNVNDTFVYRYAKNLSEKYQNVSVLNLAQPGGTTVEVINNQISQTIKFKPDYVTLLIGINDLHNKRTLGDFQKKYGFILDELLTKTDAQITVINIPYLGTSKIVYPPFNLLLDLRTKQFNNIISTVVNTKEQAGRIRYVDLYKNTYLISKQDLKYYSSDQFHPSGDGYILWGQIINAR